VLFNSIEFLCFFLPLVLGGFLLLQRTGSNRLVMLWLTCSSLFFYAWWNPAYVVLLLISASVNYGLGGMLARGGKGRGHALLLFGVLFNLGLLGYFKYTNFLMDNMRLLMDWSFNFEHIILPLAISFYTFQQITYLVDTRKGLTGPHGFLEYLLFVSFFPQLIAGPIVHHSEMLSQFTRLTEQSKTGNKLSIGFTILVIGLFKKVVIADSFALFSSPAFDLAAQGTTLSTLDAIAGSFSYAFQLYFDFSGYSDMAIGLSCLFGLKLPVNFFSPYRAQNISDFWRMWHATLSRFLRDYVYAPLGGFFCSPTRQRFNLFATMFIGGVWHGAGWTFVVYGVCHGTYVVIHQLWRIKVSGPLQLVGRSDYKAFCQLFTFVLVALTLIVFRADSLTSAGHIFSAMFNWNGALFYPEYTAALEHSKALEIISMLFGDIYSVSAVFSFLALALAICWLMPNTYQLFRHCDVVLEPPFSTQAPLFDWQWQPSMAWSFFIAVLTLISLLNLTQVSEFLYFQF
jgi:alginate O-acetyltransferase complex protein AlgI